MRKVDLRLRKAGEVVDLPAGTIVVPSKRRDDAMVLVEAGALMLSKSLPDGRRQVVGFRLANDLTTLWGNGDMQSVTLQTIVPSRIRRIARNTVEKLLESEPRSFRWLLDQIGHEVSAVQGQLLTVGRRNKEERLAAFLLEMCYRTGGGSAKSPEVSLPMHRPEIADYLGLSPETVSRVFARFTKGGLVALPNPSHVRLLDLAVLEELALGLTALDRENGDRPSAPS